MSRPDSPAALSRAMQRNRAVVGRFTAVPRLRQRPASAGERWSPRFPCNRAPHDAFGYTTGKKPPVAQVSFEQMFPEPAFAGREAN